MTLQFLIKQMHLLASRLELIGRTNKKMLNSSRTSLLMKQQMREQHRDHKPHKHSRIDNIRYAADRISPASSFAD